MFDNLFDVLQQIKNFGIAYQILFLDAEDNILINRFSQAAEGNLNLRVLLDYLQMFFVKELEAYNNLSIDNLFDNKDKEEIEKAYNF